MSKGLDEEVSMIIVPGLRDAAMPWEPSRTSRTTLPWGSMVIITEQEEKAVESPASLSLAEVVFCHSDTALRDLEVSVSWTIRW